jgi:hypothetical protein
MVEVQHAALRRTTTKDGRFCGEVEVLTNDADTPKVLAYLAAAEDGDYEMVAIVANDADTEIDWYDNPLHQAFTDRAEWFESAEMESGLGGGGREAFKEQVLSFGSVRDDLARELSF